MDTGQRCAGLAPVGLVAELAKAIAAAAVHLRGIFTHEGHDYDVATKEELPACAHQVQDDMLLSRRAVEEATRESCLVSIGSTPSLIGGAEILPGIDELRPGTYVYFDASQAAIIGHFHWCASRVVATVKSIPADDRVVLDAGAKVLTKERRGFGVLYRTEFWRALRPPRRRDRGPFGRPRRRRKRPCRGSLSARWSRSFPTTSVQQPTSVTGSSSRARGSSTAGGASRPGGKASDGPAKVCPPVGLVAAPIRMSYNKNKMTGCEIDLLRRWVNQARRTTNARVESSRQRPAGADEPRPVRECLPRA